MRPVDGHPVELHAEAAQPHGSEHGLHDQRGGGLDFEVGPEGAWISLKARYIRTEKPITIAVSPERWFAPDEDKMELLYTGEGPDEEKK